MLQLLLLLYCAITLIYNYIYIFNEKKLGRRGADGRERVERERERGRILHTWKFMKIFHNFTIVKQYIDARSLIMIAK